jgi:hypothetical protein
MSLAFVCCKVAGCGSGTNDEGSDDDLGEEAKFVGLPTRGDPGGLRSSGVALLKKGEPTWGSNGEVAVRTFSSGLYITIVTNFDLYLCVIPKIIDLSSWFGCEYK